MKINYKFLSTGCLLLFLSISCSDSFLEYPPYGSVGEATLATKAGVDGVLIAAYSLLDFGGATGGGYTIGLSGFTAGDEHNRGTESGGSTTDCFIIDPSGSSFNGFWQFEYSAINRCNDVIKLLPQVKNATEAELTQFKAEARFLRGVYYLYLAMMFRNVPWIDETIDYAKRNYFVPNTEDIYPKIEEDFKFAADNLTPTKSQAGRANKWAAKCFLAKTYMFQKKFTEAKALLDDIIPNGVTARNQKYGLQANYGDNFKVAGKNSKESVFAAQMSVNDGSTGGNGNPGEYYNGSFGGPATCCYGWTQPSFDFVDCFQTDAVTGLPLIDTYQLSPIPNDQGLTSAQAFTPYTGTLDPRLDWSVGRRGIPYLDWGVMPGKSWVRNQFLCGPYLSVKNIATQANVDKERQSSYATSVNYDLIRFPDVLLWGAECEVEVGSLSKAEEYVNIVRARAADPKSFVYKYLDDKKPTGGYSTTPAANYKVGLYPVGTFASSGKTFARKAVRFERKLELAMEWHRHFDMRRYDGNDFDIKDAFTIFWAREAKRPLAPTTNYKVAVFTLNKHELFPIPLAQIDLMKKDGVSVLVQNPGY
jgi:hypothetical protein